MHGYGTGKIGNSRATFEVKNEKEMRGAMFRGKTVELGISCDIL